MNSTRRVGLLLCQVCRWQFAKSAILESCPPADSPRCLTGSFGAQRDRRYISGPRLETVNQPMLFVIAPLDFSIA